MLCRDTRRAGQGGWHRKRDRVSSVAPSETGTTTSRMAISVGVKATSEELSGLARLDIVIQKTRQMTTAMIASSLTNRSAVRNFESSALQPDFMIL